MANSCPSSYNPSPNAIRRDNPPTSVQNSYGPSSIGGAGLFGSLRGQAGSLFKNLKDTSAKVVQTVQAYVEKEEFFNENIFGPFRWFLDR